MNESAKHPLGGLLVSQAFGAFNDNAFKLFVALLAIRAVTAAVDDSGPAFEAASQRQTVIASIPSILDKLASSGLANFFIPRRDQFMKVDNLPVLGTGKVDLRAVKRIATERVTTSRKKGSG